MQREVIEMQGESVYTADLAKKASRIQEFAEIIRELKLNQVLAKVTKLLRLILTIAAISASSER